MTEENLKSEAPKKMSLHSQLQKTKSWVALVVGTVFSIVMIGFQAAQFLDSLATKQQLEQQRDFVIKQNIELKEDIDLIMTLLDKRGKELEEARSALIDHLEKHVGRLAVERCSDKRKCALIASKAREKFRETLNRGGTIKEAVISTYEAEYP